MTLHPKLARSLQEGIFPITQRLAIGQFASDRRCQLLVAKGITHVLNVGECPSDAPVLSAGFQKVVDVLLEDFTQIPAVSAILCLDAIHNAMSQPEKKLFIHCTAGQNRSPTVLWLYLLACGMEPEDAKQLIVKRSPDAVPGHKALVDDDLIAAVRSYGQAHFQPLNDPTILDAAY